jgi:hypothetical protein
MNARRYMLAQAKTVGAAIRATEGVLGLAELGVIGRETRQPRDREAGGVDIGGTEDPAVPVATCS